MANLERFEALRRSLNLKGVGRVALQVKARPESLDAAVLAALKELGVFRIFLGVESDSERSLEALGRKSTREQNRQALRLAGEAGFHVSYNLLAFEPDTTLDEIRGHLSLIREFPAVPLGLCRTEVYGGTSLAWRLSEQGRLEGDYLGYDYKIGRSGGRARLPGLRAGPRGSRPARRGAARGRKEASPTRS